MSFILFAISTLALTSLGIEALDLRRSPYYPQAGPRDLDDVTSNILPLVRRPTQLSSVLYKKNDSTPIDAIDLGLEFCTLVKFGQQAFQLIIDTGSSDTWLASSNFTCIDPQTGQPVDQSVCAFGPLYDSSKGFQNISGERFSIQYSDGSTLVGSMGYEDVVLGGVEVDKQEIAVVDTALQWQGDGVTTGMLGLGYPSLTSAINSSDTSKPSFLQYDPLFTSMWKRGIIPPIFCLAIERGPVNEPAGVLALGGIPPISVRSPYVKTPIIKTSFQIQGAQSNSNIYQFYTIVPDAIVYGKRNQSASAAPTNIITNTNPGQYIVDSGTSLNIFPSSISNAIAALYDPPAIFDFQTLTYIVSCRATAPLLGIKIGNEILYINPQDMVFKIQGVCRSTVMYGDDSGPFILGDPFFKNVVAVFDIGRGEMRFAGRQDY